MRFANIFLTVSRKWKSVYLPFDRYFFFSSGSIFERGYFSRMSGIMSGVLSYRQELLVHLVLVELLALLEGVLGLERYVVVLLVHRGLYFTDYKEHTEWHHPSRHQLLWRRPWICA